MIIEKLMKESSDRIDYLVVVSMGQMNFYNSVVNFERDLSSINIISEFALTFKITKPTQCTYNFEDHKYSNATVEIKNSYLIVTFNVDGREVEHSYHLGIVNDKLAIAETK